MYYQRQRICKNTNAPYPNLYLKSTYGKIFEKIKKRLASFISKYNFEAYGDTFHT